MSELVTIARPYARAAFELARESGRISEWAQVLDALAATLVDEGEQSFITNPNVSRRQIADGIIGGFDGQLDTPQEQFIRLLIDTRRLLVVAEIAKLFHGYQAADDQSIQAEVVSARALDDEQIRIFRDALAKRTGKTVHLSTRVDKALIGGALVRAGDRVIDGSLKNKLKSLSMALAN